jgi:MFS family permease
MIVMKVPGRMPADDARPWIERDEPPAAWWRAGYARLLGAHGISAVGDRMSFVIVPFCLLMIGIAPGDVAFVLASRAVGSALVVLYGGILADHLSRRRIMVMSDLVRFATQAGAAALVLSQHESVIAFAVLQFCFGAAEAMFRPAAAGLI